MQTAILPVVSGSNDLIGVLTPARFLEALRHNRGRVQTYLRHRAVPVFAGTPCLVASQIMRVSNARALPVLDAKGRVVGIVTDGALLVGGRRNDPDPVEDVMVKDVLTVDPLAFVSDAATLMLERHVSQLPVVDAGGNLVDLLIDMDLVAAII